MSFTKRQMEKDATEYENYPTYIPVTFDGCVLSDEERAELEAKKKRERVERRKELYQWMQQHKQHVDVHVPCYYCCKQRSEEYKAALRERRKK